MDRVHFAPHTLYNYRPTIYLDTCTGHQFRLSNCVVMCRTREVLAIITARFYIEWPFIPSCTATAMYFLGKRKRNVNVSCITPVRNRSIRRQEIEPEVSAFLFYMVIQHGLIYTLISHGIFHTTSSHCIFCVYILQQKSVFIVSCFAYSDF